MKKAEAKSLTREENEQVEMLLQQWIDLKANLEILKETELGLRLNIVKLVFGDIDTNPDIKGTLTHNFKDGSNIKTEAKFNVKVDAEALSFSREELITNELIPIDLIFNYKPSLSTANYEKLTDSQKVKLSELLSFERATPSLKYNPPKEIKNNQEA